MKNSVFILSLLSGTACIHAAPSNPADQLSHLPPAVRKTILDAKGDGKVLDVAKKTEDGDAVYSVNVSKDGKPAAFTVSADGSVSRKKVVLEETPAPVQKTIKDKTIDAKLTAITKVTDGGDVSYDVDITQGKRDRDFTVDDDGGLLTEQVFLGELTVAVQKTIQEKAAGAELGDIIRTFDNDEPAYEVDITRAGRNRYFAVDGDGTLLGEQVFLVELSPPVRATIQAQLMAAKLGEISKVFGDAVTYEATMTKNGSSRTFTVNEDGELLDIQMPLAETPAPVQKTIREQAAGVDLDMITKLIDGGEVTYQVELTANDQLRTFYVTAKGDMLGLEIELTEAPMAVQQALQAQASSGVIEKIIKNVADGEVSFQADMTVSGKPRTVIVDAGGKVTYEQLTVSLPETPAPVQKAIQAKLGAAHLTGITRTLEDEVVSFEVEWAEDGKQQLLTLDEGGEAVPLDGK